MDNKLLFAIVDDPLPFHCRRVKEATSLNAHAATSGPTANGPARNLGDTG